MADSPVLYVYYRPDNDDAYPGVPNRHITEADWARFSLSQRRTVENATTQEGYTRRKVWVHIDLVDETEQERAEREAREQAAREAYERGQSIVRWREFEKVVPGPGEVIVGTEDGPVAVAGPSNLYEALDIWPEFNANGGSQSWNALTYDSYIAGLDASLQGEMNSGRVARAQVGTASDNTTPIFTYTAGGGAVGVLLVGGTHGAEMPSQYASMRWFQQFVTSNDAAMRRLREAFRVTYIPTLSPTAYMSSRTNSNGVDPNRNFDFFWERSTSDEPGAPDYRGPSAFSEPEAQIVRDLMEAQRFSIVLDCHVLSNDGLDAIKYGSPSSYILNSRPFAVMAMERWSTVYNRDQAFALSELSRGAPRATLSGWAEWKMRHEQGNRTAVAMTLEASNDLLGSGAYLLTRDAARGYAGVITTLLASWLETGGSVAATPPYPLTYVADIVAYRDTTPLSEGGTLIQSYGLQPVPFQRINGKMRETFDVEIVVPYAPATLTISASGYVITTSESLTPITFQIGVNGSALPLSGQRITVQAPDRNRVQFSTVASHRVTAVDASTITTVQLICNASGGSPSSSLIKNYALHVTVTPDTDDYPVPVQFA